MANQRKKGKIKVAAWLTESEREEIQSAAAKKKITVTEFIRRAITEATHGDHDHNDHQDAPEDEPEIYSNSKALKPRINAARRQSF